MAVECLTMPREICPHSASLQLARHLGEREEVVVQVRGISGDVVFGPLGLDPEMQIETVCQRMLADRPVCLGVKLSYGTVELPPYMPLGLVAMSDCIELSAVFSLTELELALPASFSESAFGIHITPGDDFDEKYLRFKVGDMRV